MGARIFNWLFYGHLWIALAALALSWQTTFLATGRGALTAVHAFVFLATLAVYTLHRYLSFRRAGVLPTHRRYALVAARPRTSLAVGTVSLFLAGAIGLTFPGRAYLPLLYALPLTAFYLVPLYPGGPRLRDLPYLKMVWVALAWALVTVSFPAVFVEYELLREAARSSEGGILLPTGAGHYDGAFYRDLLIRFLLVLGVALLFDVRDTRLDADQGVRTLAATHPRLNQSLAVALFVLCALLSFRQPEPYAAVALTAAYLIAAGFALATHAGRSEDYYAVYLNGLLVLPPGLLLLLAATWPRSLLSSIW